MDSHGWIAIRHRNKARLEKLVVTILEHLDHRLNNDGKLIVELNLQAWEIENDFRIKDNHDFQFDGKRA